MASTYVTLDALFKQKYTEGLEDLTFKERPLFGLLPKYTDVGGASASTRAWHIPLKFANTSAVGGTFATAQTRAATVSSKVVAWELVTMHQYGFINLDMESILRSEGKEHAFVDEKSLEMDAIIENMSNRLHHFCYLDGTGSLAIVGNATQMPSFAVSKMILSNPETAVYWSYGDELTASLTASGGTPRALGANGHGWYVIAINLDEGSFTVGTAAGAAVNLNDANDGIPTATNGDFIQHRGDVQVHGTVGGTVISGFADFIPSTSFVFTPGAASTLYNVDRSAAVDFLAGSRYDGSNLGIEEAIVRGTNVVAKKGGIIKQIFINHKHFSDLVAAISARGMVNFLEISPTEYPEIGFEAVRIIGAKGSVEVIPDYACPSTQGTGMRLEDWYFASVGEPVRVMNGDGLEFLRLSNSDGLQAYWASYSNTVPLIPRNNLNLLLAA
jgi:hypothetical protein